MDEESSTSLEEPVELELEELEDELDELSSPYAHSSSNSASCT